MIDMGSNYAACMPNSYYTSIHTALTFLNLLRTQILFIVHFGNRPLSRLLCCTCSQYRASCCMYMNFKACSCTFMIGCWVKAWILIRSAYLSIQFLMCFSRLLPCTSSLYIHMYNNMQRVSHRRRPFPGYSFTVHVFYFSNNDSFSNGEPGFDLKFWNLLEYLGIVLCVQCRKAKRATKCSKKDIIMGLIGYCVATFRYKMMDYTSLSALIICKASFTFKI